MKRDVKAQMISRLEEDFRRHNTLLLMDYTGMKVAQAVTLRRLLKKSSYGFRVVKNRLALRAIAESFPPEFRSYLERPTAVAMASADPVKLARMLKDFSTQNKVMAFKGGLFEGQLLRPERFDEICRLASREELLGKVGALMAAPLLRLLRTWQAPLSQMGLLLSQFKEKKWSEVKMTKAKDETTKLTKEQFFTHLDSLTVLELADYIKEFETRYGISAAAAVPIASPGAAAAPGAEAKVEEAKTEFTVVLKAAGDKKINVIKIVREITNLGLKEAKDLVDSVPKPVKEKVTKEEAESIKAKFEEVGATVELQ